MKIKDIELMMTSSAHKWSIEEVRGLYALPLLQLISQSHAIHLQFHQLETIQICHLISIKTGGCLEDCKYCAQSSYYQTSVKALPMMTYEQVLEAAKAAVAKGATRICLGAAWREIKDNKPFQAILNMIKGIANLGVEVCCTLGMLNLDQAKLLKEAGLHAYNHNLDSSKNFYKTIITTRSYQDRIDTLKTAAQADLSLCCGGIFGMGESIEDRLELLLTLSQHTPSIESVPINRLVPIEGTPLENQGNISSWEMIRMIAIARILLPSTMIRLSAGRIEMSYEEQALCFLSGANSIFAGDKLLTVANTALDKDKEMFELLGLKKRPPFHHDILHRK